MKFTRFILLRRMNLNENEENTSTSNINTDNDFFKLFKDVIINQPNIDISISLIFCLIILIFKSNIELEMMFSFNIYLYVRLMISIVIYMIFIEILDKVKFHNLILWHTFKSLIRIIKILLYSLTYFLGLIFSLTFASQESFIDKGSESKFHLFSLQFFAFYSLFRVGYFFIKIFCNVFLCNVYFSSVILSILEDIFNHKLNKFINTQPFSIKQPDYEDSDYCSICLGVFNSLELISILPCSRRHSFHTKCIEKWFINTITCPLCRSDFNSSRINNINPYQELNEIRENLI